ncbi:hypothetical protein [Urechidicola croceus]|uniref:Uncharacterized protein n=1 Tax=Urechidicola croceus TaxID=1850246 RepID=A0A1D8P7I4_9FLAO|nr:hypothetical protein [Urechidicola croceus]AOW20536.1 hypothetical protein LPB138_07530 [Urechidicola croceus]
MIKTIVYFDLNYFLEIDYLEVCKTFEAEDSLEQYVKIFIIDKDEIKNGKSLLREMQFSRPVKI